MFVRTKTIFLLSIILFTLSVTSNLSAQDSESTNFKFKSFGISLGVYYPELDYWKNDSNSVFRNSDFSTSIFVKGFAEYRLYKNFVVKAGIEYWQSRAETTISKYGKTEMLLTGIPLSLDLVYYLAPAKFAFVTPYIGIGGELVLIQYNLDFANKDNPDPQNGTSGVGSGILGLEMQLSKNFGIDIFATYKVGKYQQNFIRENTSIDPEVPSAEYEVTEDISLSGPALGISLKYLF